LSFTSRIRIDKAAEILHHSGEVFWRIKKAGAFLTLPSSFQNGILAYFLAPLSYAPSYSANTNGRAARFLEFLITIKKLKNLI
jgi:hypothetical protein